jgi:homoserine dehydrogenase
VRPKSGYWFSDKRTENEKNLCSIFNFSATKGTYELFSSFSRAGCVMIQGPLRIGLAGPGTVGSAVLELLATKADALAQRAGRALEVVAISGRSRRHLGNVDIQGCAWYDDPVALAKAGDIDVFVELIGGAEEPARAAVEAALARGINVVTANKALLARHGMALAALAEANQVSLSFEAAVAGGVPIIKTLRESLAGNRIDRVSGILNGTCNYILSRMEQESLSFADCLATAQALGYAEADPTFDIGGFDAAHKLALLTCLAFGTQVDAEAIHIEGIETITLADIQAAAELGYRIRLLGVAIRQAGGIEQRVHPTMVPLSSALAQVHGPTNAIAINGDAVPALTLIGPGAGGMATASSVVADLVDLARGQSVRPFGRPCASLEPLHRSPMQKHEGGYYIRLHVPDRAGIMGAIATRMGEHQISLESIVQKSARLSSKRGGESEGDTTCVILVTHATGEAALRLALDTIIADGTIVEPPQIIRIERA